MTELLSAKSSGRAVFWGWGAASQRSYRILGRVPQSGAQSHLSGSNRDGLLQIGD